MYCCYVRFAGRSKLLCSFCRAFQDPPPRLPGSLLDLCKMGWNPRGANFGSSLRGLVTCREQRPLPGSCLPCSGAEGERHPAEALPAWSAPPILAHLRLLAFGQLFDLVRFRMPSFFWPNSPLFLGVGPLSSWGWEGDGSEASTEPTKCEKGVSSI